ncbi:hypothetical protein SLS60_005767 [Paraconiothyrium brasiliense]|uniref:Uncharacterized protein n=1 Tax=Paraconiothyrium brasiliense TaxID=300254 RepID=A0ABR3RD24_9PLEO
MSAQLSKQIPHDHFENRNDPTGLERHRTTFIALAQYKNRCQKLEKDRANLKTELRRTTSIFAQANGIDKELMRKVRSQTRDVIELKSRLQEIDSLEPYMALGQAHDVALTTEKLHLDFQIMKNELGSLPVLNAGRQISVESLYGQSDDLDLLLHTILHSNTESNAESVPKAGPTFALREVIQALTGAAVKVWAFESTLGLTSMMTTPLLQKYRDHIATMCGQEGLCNLDFAAHDAMIQGKDFEENTIAPVASRLTKRLLNVLRLVIGHQDAHETLKRLGPRLACIMKPAIHLRSLSLVSAKRLESIWPSPGASLEELEMSVEPPLEARTGDLVRLPILPGLRAYHNEKEMISYRGFGDSNLASGHPDHTIKALVIV